MNMGLIIWGYLLITKPEMVYASAVGDTLNSGVSKACAFCILAVTPTKAKKLNFHFWKHLLPLLYAITATKIVQDRVL